MRDKLYWTISKFSIRSLIYDDFVFFDTTPYLADQLFIRHKVRVWFDQEYTSNSSPYLAILCHVRKKDVSGFLAALEELKDSMILCGHPHYVEEISSLMDEMEKLKGAMHGDGNGADQKIAHIRLIPARLLERCLANNPYCVKQEGI